MQLKEILELLNTKGWNQNKIAKEKLTFGVKRLTPVLEELGFKFSNIAPKGWSFNGDPSVLEQSIYDFVAPTVVRTRVKANAVKESKSVRNDMPTNKPISNTTILLDAEPTNEKTTIMRKRASFDIDESVLKRLRVYAIMNDKNTYELVENAIIKLLDELEK